ncbi:MAG TPA: hypothetical protein VJH96_00340 [Patescibacteria group bacterium]|nr:hypothetical protein [Patescibacteria group bacterium]
MKKFFVLCIFCFFAVLQGIFITQYYRMLMCQLSGEKILSEIEKLKKNTQKVLPAAQDRFVLGAVTGEINLGDARGENVRKFFGKYNSPLYDYADFIVEISDKYGMDYRLLPAIAMQESQLCKHMPDNSYNCWGYGMYGGRVMRFSSFQEAIETVAKDLRENYLEKGYTTPELVMQKYTPSSNGSWAHSINFFIQLLE